MVTRVVGTFGKSIESHALSNYIDYLAMPSSAQERIFSCDR